MNHYKRHIGDWLRDTVQLSALQEGVYSRLADQYYSREKPLPLDLAACCRLARTQTKDEREAVAFCLQEFFTKVDAGYQQKRCDEEIAAYQTKSARNREAGKLGGRPPNFSRPKVPQGTKPSGADPGNPDETQTVSGINPDGIQAGQKPEPTGPPDINTDGLQTETQTVIEQEPKNNPSHKPLAISQAKAKAIGAIAPHSAGPSKPGSDPPEIRQVFDHWRTVCGHPAAKLGDRKSKRFRTIAGRLRDGYTAEQLCAAVDGIRNSPHHMGDNDRHEVYDDIELICRDGAHVDKFIRFSSGNSEDFINGHTSKASLQQQELQQRIAAARALIPDD